MTINLHVFQFTNTTKKCYLSIFWPNMILMSRAHAQHGQQKLWWLGVIFSPGNLLLGTWTCLLGWNLLEWWFLIVKANKSIFQTISDHHVCSVKINLRKHWHDRGDGGAAYLWLERVQCVWSKCQYTTWERHDLTYLWQEAYSKLLFPPLFLGSLGTSSRYLRLTCINSKYL